ncbi:MAG: xanthine dehydrogenase family protein subunit M [Chloroflexi bacterium]|nr:xanthine dehydrogenase family protein subunit M [Chloroflexota bacterium]
MNLPEFVHFAPGSLQDACALLSAYKQEARVLAGGTDLLVKMKHRRLLPKYLVNIKRVPDLDYITYEEKQGLRIGALATIESLKNSVVVRTKYPILHSAASFLGTVEIRNRGTIGGNICNASPAAETVPALLVLGAKVRAISDGGERIIPLDEFFTGPSRSVLQPDELVVEVLVPEPAARSGAAYDKHTLRRMDPAIVGAAVMVSLDSDVCADAKIVLSSVAPTAMRARNAEEALKGQVPGEEVIDKAAWAAAEESRPITDFRGTADFRRNVVGMLTGQLIKQAFKEAGLGVAQKW